MEKEKVFPADIAARLKNVATWVSRLPVKEEFKMVFKAAATLPTETKNIADEEEKEADDDEVSSEEDMIRGTENPFIHRSKTPAITYALKPPFNCGNRSYNFGEQEIPHLKRSAILSNPATDVEIHLGTKSEVVNLDEKTKYQLLLDKYVSTAIYAESQKKLKTSPSSTSEPEDDIDPLFYKKYNMKDVLNQPVTDFINEYYVPPHSVLKENSKSSNNKESNEEMCGKSVNV